MSMRLYLFCSLGEFCNARRWGAALTHLGSHPGRICHCPISGWSTLEGSWIRFCPDSKSGSGRDEPSQHLAVGLVFNFKQVHCIYTKGVVLNKMSHLLFWRPDTVVLLAGSRTRRWTSSWSSRLHPGIYSGHLFSACPAPSPASTWETCIAILLPN